MYIRVYVQYANKSILKSAKNFGTVCCENKEEETNTKKKGFRKGIPPLLPNSPPPSL